MLHKISDVLLSLNLSPSFPSREIFDFSDKDYTFLLLKQ